MRRVILFLFVAVTFIACSENPKKQERDRQYAIHLDEIRHYPVLFTVQHRYEEKRANGSSEISMTVYAEGFKDTSIVWDKMELDARARVSNEDEGDMIYVIYFRDKEHTPKLDSEGMWPDEYEKYVLGIYRRYATGQSEFEKYLK